MANDPPFATLNHFTGDLGIPSESDSLRIGINAVDCPAIFPESGFGKPTGSAGSSCARSRPVPASQAIVSLNSTSGANSPDPAQDSQASENQRPPELGRPFMRPAALLFPSVQAFLDLLLEPRRQDGDLMRRGRHVRTCARCTCLGDLPPGGSSTASAHSRCGSLDPAPSPRAAPQHHRRSPYRKDEFGTRHRRTTTFPARISVLPSSQPLPARVLA